MELMSHILVMIKLFCNVTNYNYTLVPYYLRTYQPGIII